MANCLDNTKPTPAKLSVGAPMPRTWCDLLLSRYMCTKADANRGYGEDRSVEAATKHRCYRTTLTVMLAWLHTWSPIPIESVMTCQAQQPLRDGFAIVSHDRIARSARTPSMVVRQSGVQPDTWRRFVTQCSDDPGRIAEILLFSPRHITVAPMLCLA